MDGNKIIGILGVLIAVFVLFFGDNIVERYNEHKEQPINDLKDTSENALEEKYRSLIEEADNELRKNSVDYKVALVLYQKAYEIAISDSNLSPDKAKQGIARCEQEILKSNTDKGVEITKAKITFINSNGFQGLGFLHDIIINDKLCGEISSGEKKSIEVNPGICSIFLKANRLADSRNILIENLNILPNDVYEINIKIDNFPNLAGDYSYVINKIK